MSKRKIGICSIFHFVSQSPNPLGTPELLSTLIWASTRENLSSGFANNRLISAFVIHFLKNIISKFASREISIFWLVSVAAETGLSVALSETPKTGFLSSRSIYLIIFESRDIVSL